MQNDIYIRLLFIFRSDTFQAHAVHNPFLLSLTKCRCFVTATVGQVALSDGPLRSNGFDIS